MNFAAKVREALAVADTAPREELLPILGEIGRADAIIRGRLACPVEDDKLLPIAEAAEMLSMGKATLYRKQDTLPFAVRVGGCVRFSRAGIRRYLAIQGAA